MAAAHHQVKIVDLLHFLPLRDERFDELLFIVIDQHKNMRNLQRGAFTDLDPGRNTFRDSAFRSADPAGGSLCKIIIFQVNSQHQPPADPVINMSLHKDHTRMNIKEIFREIFTFFSLNICDLLFLIDLPEIVFRESDLQC